MNNIIRIAIKGQVDNDTRIIFPNDFNPANNPANDWMKSIADPRDDARDFIADRIFVYWKSADAGNFYGIIFPSPVDSREGLLIAVINSGRYLIKSGTAVRNALLSAVNVVSGRLRSGTPISKEDMSSISTALEQKLVPDTMAIDMSVSNQKAYRKLDSDADADRFFEFPNQTEYAKFKRIFGIVKGDLKRDLATPVPGLTELKSPIKVAYRIDTNTQPTDVTIYQYAISAGEKLKITYTKPGFAQTNKEVLIDGISNNYIQYSGTEIHLNDASTAGIIFNRTMKVNVRDEMDRAIRAFTTSPYDNLNGTISVPDNGNEWYEIKIEAKGYKSENVNFKQEDLLIGSITVKLTPVTDTICLYIKTGNSLMSGDVTVKGNSPIYQTLTKVSQTQPLSFSKSTQDYPGKKGNEPDSGEIRFYKKLCKILFGIVLAFALTIIVLLIFHPSAKPATSATPGAVVTETITETTYTPEISPNTLPAEGVNPKIEENNRQHDIEYLKKYDIWKYNDIITEKYKQLFGLIVNQQISEINITDYFNDNDLINGYLNDEKIGLIYLYAMLKDRDKEKEAKDILRRYATKKSINLKKISTELSKLSNPGNPTTQGENTEVQDVQLHPNSD